jgi:uncharacterized protein YyaL (SSP411 family)
MTEQESSQQSHPHTNRLAEETSPYLLQHAHNPVDWYAWGAEAWERAKAENKPVLVSIGYAACHWCHVMERESFEDEALAAQQNELFVSIKVDREERPDIDDIYMEAVQLIHGQGGWPLNVFCTPDGLPFYGGTYFPPQGRQGMPGWPEVLVSVAKAFHEQPENVVKQGQQIIERIESRVIAFDDGRAPGAAESFDLATTAVMENYEPQHGGYGSAPKFPQPYFLALLMQSAVALDDEKARTQVLFTLRKMAEGGMYDQLAGGFHRYSVDAEWLVPHFEKMLYDNALLPPIYLDAARLTGEPFYARVAEETLDYLVRELRTPEGAFYASTDADSEGVEGKYFVWSQAEVDEVLGEEAALFSAYYDVMPGGNFEGSTILNVASTLEKLAEQSKRSVDEVEVALAAGRAALLERRAGRVPPATDTKVIVSWNGMAIDALARGGAVLNAPRFIEAAEGAASFILESLRDKDGLLRIYAGGRTSVRAFLDDYAALADGLLSLYEATGEERWFEAAQSLVAEMIAKYWDPKEGGFFTTGSGNEALVARNKPIYDGATPSGNSLAARAMARLYALTSEGLLADRLEAMARAHGALLERAPTTMSLLVLTRDWLTRHQTVAVVGEKGAPETEALVRAVWEGAPRSTILMQREPGAGSVVPQLEGKEPVDGKATAYVCHGFACSAPVTTVEALRQLLAAGVPE